MFFKGWDPPKSVKKANRKKVVPNCIHKFNFERFGTPKFTPNQPKLARNAQADLKNQKLPRQ